MRWDGYRSRTFFWCESKKAGHIVFTTFRIDHKHEENVEPNYVANSFFLPSKGTIGLVSYSHSSPSPSPSPFSFSFFPSPFHQTHSPQPFSANSQTPRLHHSSTQHTKVRCVVMYKKWTVRGGEGFVGDGLVVG